MQNLLTHCNHQARAWGATDSQGKSSRLSFRRTKQCFPSAVKNYGMWRKEENGTPKWNRLREFCVSPLASEDADSMMQSGEGNNVAVALWVKIKDRNNGLTKETATGFQLVREQVIWKRRMWQVQTKRWDSMAGNPGRALWLIKTTWCPSSRSAL